jgi:phosphohistidine phosphatase SixA
MDVSGILRTLYLLRHAKSSWHIEVPGVLIRPLTEQRRDAVKEVSKSIAAENLGKILIIGPAVLRARESRSCEVPSEIPAMSPGALI